MAEPKQSSAPDPQSREPDVRRPAGAASAREGTTRQANAREPGAREARARIASAAAPAGRGLASRPLRLLVVDDDPNLGDSLGDVLTEKGYELVVVTEGEKALRLLGTEQFDMALVDIRMPGLDGAATARRIHSLAPDLPVAMITGYAFDELARQTLEEGAVAVLGKPLDIDHLVKLIERTVKRPTVLIVETEPAEAQRLRATLEGAACLGVVASSLGAARQALTQSTFDVIFLDCALLRQHGPDSLVEVTRLAPNAYLVFLACAGAGRVARPQSGPPGSRAAAPGPSAPAGQAPAPAGMASPPGARQSDAGAQQAPAADELSDVERPSAASEAEAAAEAGQRTLELQVRHTAFAVLEDQASDEDVLRVIERIRVRMKERGGER